MLNKTNNNKREARPARKRTARGGPKVKPEFEHKVVDVRRVTRVMAGGRRFSFSVAVVIGDKKGKVGVGIGKAGDTALAIEKAMNVAKKNMIKLPLTAKLSIPHEVTGKFNASRVYIKPAPGQGLSAGSSVRVVLNLAGVTDVNAKLLTRSKNKLNNARSAMVALKNLSV